MIKNRTYQNSLNILNRFFRKTLLIAGLLLLTCAGSALKAQTPYEIWNWADLAYLNTMLQQNPQTEWNAYGQKAILMQDLGIPGQPGTYGDGTGCTVHTGDAAKGWYGYQGYTGAEAAFDAATTTTACGWNATEGWTPIGDDINPFTGNFDGQGFEISGVWIDRSLSDYQALFGYAESAVVKNTGMNTGKKGIIGRAFVGGLVGYLDAAQIQDCAVSGNVTGNSIAGGMVGMIDKSSIVSGCYASCNVSSMDGAGGLVGLSMESRITNSYTACDVKSKVGAGGIVGIAWTLSTISNCYALGGNIAGAQDSTGRILGINVTLFGSQILTNNHAFECMKVNGSTVDEDNGTGLNGIDISAKDAQLAAQKDLGVTLNLLSCEPGISNVKVNFACPGEVTVTYDLNTVKPTDVTLYYSHNKKEWLIAKTVTGDLTAQTTGTGKTIHWDNVADNVRYGRFYFKVEAPQAPVEDCVMINGVCWATRNVDAPGTFAANPEDAGMFCQWNRNIGWSSTDPMQNSNGGTTWDSSMPGGTTWETTNDVCPSGYRIPTQAELSSLLATAQVATAWTTQNGVNGRLFTDQNNGNSLFLPAAGGRDSSDGALNSAGSGGNYWSSTQDISSSAYYLYFYSVIAGVSSIIRHYGHAVRCVAE